MQTHHVLLCFFSKVVEAERRADGQIFALKILSDSPKARREVEIHLLACSHKNIVTIYDVYENLHKNAPALFVIMEKLNGGELFARIQVSRRRSACKMRHRANRVEKCIFFRSEQKLRSQSARLQT